MTKEKEILSDDKKIAEHFNEYFVHITDALDTMEWPASTNIEDINDKSLKAILKYANHPSIITIKDEFPIKDTFTFKHITRKSLQEEIRKLDSSKSTS